jgi:uncharacterized OB-fold protein
LALAPFIESWLKKGPVVPQSTPSSPRPLPAINQDNHSFWTGGGKGALMIMRCAACRNYIHPPVRFCPRCESRDVGPEQVSGRARVYSFTVNHKVWIPGLQVPYVLALVEIEEQEDIYLPTNITGCDPADVYIGMPVEVIFEPVEDLFVPLFRPVTL